MLADAGLEVSAGKMSSWWAGTPPTLRLEELDVVCAVLECTPNDLLTPEPDKVAARRPRAEEAANGDDHPRGGGALRRRSPRRPRHRASTGRGPRRRCKS